MMSWTMDGREEQENSASWNRNSSSSSKPPNMERDEMMMSSLCGFKPMMEIVADDEWYMSNTNTTTTILHNHHQPDMMMMRDMAAFSPTNFGDPSDNSNNLLLHHHPVDSSSSCSPSPSMFTNLGVGADPSASHVHQYFLPPPPPSNPKATTLLLSNNNNNNNPFEIGCEMGFLEPQGSTNSPVLQRGPSPSSSTLLGGLIPDLASKNQLISLPNLGSSDNSNNTHSAAPTTKFPPNITGFAGFQSFDEGSGKSLFLNRSKILRPLESLPPSGAQPTLFQKRAALRKNNMGTEQGGVGMSQILSRGKKCDLVGDGGDNKRKAMMMMMMSSGDEMEDASFDGSALNYDSDDLVESNNNSKVVMVDENNVKNNGGNSSNGNNSTVTGADHKGKKKGMPAKNLMAERRRRKKLNDRLYMLRSVVPKISKMDRASILGDAIEYLKELLQRINDLHNELESTTGSGGSNSLTPVSSFHPLTPTPPALPSRIKEEMCPSSLPSPNGQPARVEVRLREGRAVNIHMFCGRKPGLLLSTMRALDNLGLDIQQAVISCFNGFAMDVFRAEQCKEEQDVHPDQIKAVLLDTAGYPPMI